MSNSKTRRTGPRMATVALSCFVILCLLASSALAATYRVTRNHDGGWHMQHMAQHSYCPGPPAGSQEFVTGPQGAPGAPDDGETTEGDSPTGNPPAGVGSLKMETPDGPELEYFRNTNYDGVLLTNITDLTYWTYTGEDVTGFPNEDYTPAIYVVLQIDTDENGVVDDELVLEPEYQDENGDGQHDVRRGAWQKWVGRDANTTPPEGMWFLRSQYERVRVGLDNSIEYKSLEGWTADTARVGPDATIQNPAGTGAEAGRELGGVVLAAGCGSPGPWDGFVGYTDDFRITVSGTQDTYDFDPQRPTDPAVLDCEPESDHNPTGTNHTVTCTVTTEDEVPVNGVQVDVEATGANDPDRSDSKTTPDFFCNTAQQGTTQGTCSFTHSGTTEDGVTTYVAWVDDDNDNKTVEADDDEGQQATADEKPSPAPSSSPTGSPSSSASPTPSASPSSSPGDTEEPDTTDVVTKTWIKRVSQSGGVDAEPEDDTNELGDSHTITATVYDQFGDALADNTVVNFEFFHNSPSDDDGNTPGFPDETCTTANTWSCSITYTQSANAGADRVCVWTNTAPAMSGDNTNGTCDGEGLSDPDDTPGSADQQNDADTSSEAADDVDVVRKTWTRPPAARLECLPESGVSPTGSAHRITCTATTARNAASPGVNIDAEITGANDPDNSDSRTTPDLTCTTGSDGTCVLTHGIGGTGGSSQQGLTTYRAWIDINNSDGISEEDPTEGRDESIAPGTRPEPDNTEVVETRWQSSPLECEPETSTGPVGTTHRITCSAPSGSLIDVEAVGANDPDNGDSNTSPDFTCTTTSSGSCVVSHVVGSNGTVGTTTYRAWLDTPGSDTTVEADTAEGQDETTAPGAVPERDNTDVVTRTWTQEERFACNDGDDNDDDLRVDFPSDPGCTSSTDDSEDDDAGEPEPTFPDQNFGGESDQPVTTGPCRGYTTGSVQQGPEGDGLVIVGTSGPDLLQGGDAADLICGLGGRDTVAGGGGADSIYGQGDSDSLDGGSGNDLLTGGGGDDTLRGRGDADTLKGFSGNDTLLGGGADDIIQGGGGNDLARGRSGDDTLKGFSGRDRLFGGGGTDKLRGRSGNDTLVGGPGNDVLNGGGGRDSCLSGGGSDRMRRCE